MITDTHHDGIAPHAAFLSHEALQRTRQVDRRNSSDLSPLSTATHFYSQSRTLTYVYTIQKDFAICHLRPYHQLRVQSPAFGCRASSY